jgi:hypothetical protein
MRDARGLWLGLLGVALGAGAPVGGAAPAGAETEDELLALLEFLGDEAKAGEGWNGFFDSLPERLPGRPDDALLPAPTDPVADGEAEP